MDRLTDFDIDDYLHGTESPELDTSAPTRTRKIADYCQARDEALRLYRRAEKAWCLFQARIDRANQVAKFAAPTQTNHHFAALEFGKIQGDTKGNGDRAETYRRRIDRAVWEHLIEDTKFSSLMDAQAKKEFRAELSNPPPVTEANCASTIGQLYADAGAMQCRGLVNIFTKLNCIDYKSNDCFSIGKRIIVERVVERPSYSSCISWNYHAYDRRDALIDLERTIDIMEGRQAKGPNETIVRHVEACGLNEKEYENDMFKLRWYNKGTLHAYIKSAEIRAKLNRMIAEHFGAQLGDDSGRPNAHDPFFKGKKRSRSTGIDKVDRNAYYTPPKVAAILAREAGLADYKGSRIVLDPSCGHGALMRAAFDAGARHIHGIENHIASANACLDDMTKRFKAEGATIQQWGDNLLHVFKCDFEKWEKGHGTEYSHILMNPPFDHQLRHVVKAYGHLAKGRVTREGETIQGRLVAIMGANVWTNQSQDYQTFRAWLKAKGATIKRLPTGSFRESGTDVETILVKIPAAIDR